LAPRGRRLPGAPGRRASDHAEERPDWEAGTELLPGL
jgi:hypothetical protein